MEKNIDLMTVKNLFMLWSIWIVAVAHLGSSQVPSNTDFLLLYIFFSYVAYSALRLAQEKNSWSQIYPPSGVGLTRSPPPRQNGSVTIKPRS